MPPLRVRSISASGCNARFPPIRERLIRHLEGLQQPLTRRQPGAGVIVTGPYLNRLRSEGVRHDRRIVFTDLNRQVDLAQLARLESQDEGDGCHYTTLTFHSTRGARADWNLDRSTNGGVGGMNERITL